MEKKHSNPADRARELRRIIDRHNRLYYIDATPEVEDREYDTLYRELENIEINFPDLRTPDSPTLRIGGAPLGEFLHVKHMVPMMSLANTYDTRELHDFGQRLKRILPDTHFDYILEPKIDGVAVSLRYENGLFVRGSTRGDGISGDDITENLRTIRSIPLSIRTRNKPPPILEVRGEVYMTRTGFLDINIQRENAGMEPFANPRNAAAGSLKLLDSAQVAGRPLDAVLYATGELQEINFSTHEDLIISLREYGFQTVPEYWVCASIDDVIESLKMLDTKRRTFIFETDGGVIKVNNRNLYAALGSTAKSPRWAVAFKYEPERAETRINAISIQVGRTGVLTPVAELEPVSLAGSVIRRATLHNADEIQRKDIRTGDKAVIEKAGDVIPAVVAVNTDVRTGEEEIFSMPSFCPVCGEAVIRTEGEVAVRCEN
ncbi:MAG: NAD-dependent DNA ligase LigA, partial [Kiritimatiellae bacterium]|nr:NAD-dependent DNA ligase LigA [Kiritimatiellia bacterium]